MKIRRNYSALLAGVSFSVLTAVTAQAQTAPTATAKSQAALANATALEEVIVTAERREESLQRVPITVSAVNEQQLRAAAVSGSLEIGQMVSGVVFTKNIGSASPFIRGVGPGPTGQPGYEQPVAIYVDGVYLPNINQAASSLRSVQRVEVLKGPQGTLFGRNSAAGVINIITKTPSFEPSANLSLGYGSYHTSEGEFYGTTRLSDTMAVNLSLYGMDQAEGWGYNPRTGEETFTQSGYLARAKVLWQPSAATRVVAGANYDYGTTYQGPTQGVFPGALGPDGVTRYISRYVINSNNSGIGTTETWGTNVHVEHDFGTVRTNSILAWNHLKSLVSVDADSTPIVINEADPFYTDDDTYTAEFHIMSPSESRISWIGGAFFLKDDLVVDEQLNNSRGMNRLVMPMHTKSWSVFGEVNIPVLEDTKLTIGTRYTNDTKDYLYKNYDASVSGFPLLPVAANGCAPLINLGGTCYGEKSWGDFSYRVALDHQLTDNSLLYASWNRGFQSGAFNVTAPNSLVNPVTVDAFEVGVKNELFDRRVRLNASGFYYDYQNLQARANIGGIVQVFNAAQATIKGVDLDFEIRASEHLTVRASVEYLDAVYDEFKAFENIVPRPAGGNQRIGTRDVSGYPVVRSPKWTANFGATYDIPTSVGTFTLNGNYAYNDGFDWEPGGSLKQPAYSVINATIIWTSPDEAYEVSLAGRNLTDEDYFLKGGRAGTSDSYVPAAPRTYMATVSRHF